MASIHELSGHIQGTSVALWKTCFIRQLQLHSNIYCTWHFQENQKLLCLQQDFFHFSFTRMTKTFPWCSNSSCNTTSRKNDHDIKISETVDHISETNFKWKALAIQVLGNVRLAYHVFNTNSTKIQTHAKRWMTQTQNFFTLLPT